MGLGVYEDQGTKMKYPLIAFVMLVIIQSISGFTLVETIQLDENGRPGAAIGKYVPFVAEKESVYYVDAVAMQKKRVFTEDFWILSMDYDSKTKRIVYTYGHGEEAAPAIFDVVNNEKHRLDELFSSDTGQKFFYTVFRSVHWIDKETILYSVVNPVKHEVEIRSYDLRRKETRLLASKPNIEIEHLNRQEMLVAYSWQQGRDDRMFEILDLRTGAETSLGALEYYNVVVLGKNCYLSFMKENEAWYDRNYRVDVVENKRIVYSERDYNISSNITYSPEDKLLVAYMYIDKLFGDEAVGVFRVPLTQECTFIE
jgi:hypothetical protein